jgi:two-component system chemotaxis sensor kinase CheA
VTIDLRDDGRGIDWETVRSRARDAGRPHATRSDLVSAILSDGITTRSDVTRISGRGVGLAALRDACRGLGGRIDVDSERGCGTQFRFEFNVERPDRTTSRIPRDAMFEQPR